MAKHRCAHVIFDEVNPEDLGCCDSINDQYWHYCLKPATKVKSGLHFCDDHFEAGVGFEH
jgi:hypothetical protein